VGNATYFKKQVAPGRQSRSIDRAGHVNRFEKYPHSGGICISAAARANFKEQPSIHFFPLGRRHVQNIGVPVEIFWILFNKEQIADLELVEMQASSRVMS
jgi:hypothetical protein